MGCSALKSSKHNDPVNTDIDVVVTSKSAPVVRLPNQLLEQSAKRVQYDIKKNPILQRRAHTPIMHRPSTPLNERIK